jgi:hypothetical protein
MDLIPKDLYLVVLSYLDLKPPASPAGLPVDEESINNLDTLHVLEAFPREMNTTDWIVLFNTRFPQYYSRDLYTYGAYGVKNIYLELLVVNEMIKGRSIRRPRSNKNRNHYNTLTIEYIPNVIKAYKNIFKYLIFKKYVTYDVDRIISLLDDIELFQQYIKEYPEDLNLYTHVSNNSVNILKYIFESGLYLHDEEDDFGWFTSAYEEHDVNLETTKLLFEHEDFDEFNKLYSLVNYYSDDRESFDYILSTLNDLSERNILYDIITSDAEYNRIIKFLNFKALWDKFNRFLTSEQIINMYEGFINAASSDWKDAFKIISLLAHQPAVEKEYLG